MCLFHSSMTHMMRAKFWKLVNMKRKKTEINNIIHI